MCSVIAGLTALGGAMQYRSQQQQANAQAAMYRQQAAVAEQNAKIENRKQEQIADQYADSQQRLRAQQRLNEGRLRASTGAAGLNFGGSAMDILTSSSEQAQQDQLNLLSNQRNDNYNSRITQSNWINQANAANTAANNVKKAARIQGIGTILGTAASVYGASQTWKNAGSNSAAGFGNAPSNYTSTQAADAWNSANYAFPTVTTTGKLAGKNIGGYSYNSFNKNRNGWTF